MAGDWIAIRSRLAHDAKTLAMARELAMEPDLVVGKLVRLWGWADEEADETGRVEGVALEDLDRLVQSKGFAFAMSAVGWLEVVQSDNGNCPAVEFPNWQEYMSQSAKRRLQDARRKRLERDSGQRDDPKPHLRRKS